MSINADGYGLNEALVSAIEAIVLAVAPGSSGVSSVGGQTGVVSLKSINSAAITGSGDIPLQVVLVSGTNIKTVNSTSLLGSGNIVIAGGGASAYVDLTDHTTVDLPGTNSPLGTALAAKQATLVSGTNIKTINTVSILGTGDLTVSGAVHSVGGATGDVALKTVNSQSLVGTGNIVISGGSGGSPTPVAYDTEVDLTDPNGFTMALHYLVADDVMTIASGAVDGGFTTGTWLSDEVHTPVQPAGVVMTGDTFLSEKGRWNNFTYAKVGSTLYCQIINAYLSPLLDTLVVADGAPTILIVKFATDLDQTGSASALFSLFTVSGGAHTPTASAWGAADEILLTVPSFASGASLTASFTNDGSVKGVDGSGAVNFSAFAIDNQVSAATNFRWQTITGAITETGTGPYTYTFNFDGAGPDRSAYTSNGNLKFGAGDVCEIVCRKLQVTNPDANHERFGFAITATDNTTEETAGGSPHPVLLAGPQDGFFYSVFLNGVDQGATSYVIAVGSAIRIRKDAAHSITLEIYDENGDHAWHLAGTYAGSNVDYFIKAGWSLGSGAQGGNAYQIESQTGMVPA